jgi:hypothetical protein
LLDALGNKQYESLIGALQWLVTLERFDIHLSVATMSRYRCAPGQGHLKQLKHIYSYLRRNPSCAISIRIKIPNHEALATPVQYDWTTLVYGIVTLELTSDQPIPRGKLTCTTTYQDSNLYHDLVTRRAMSGKIHFVNQTADTSSCKKQQSVATATFGSEFMVLFQAAQQIIDLWYTLRMMGIPLDGPYWIFGDNEIVITSSTIPNSNLYKHKNVLSYHCVCECIAAKVFSCSFYWAN